MNFKVLSIILALGIGFLIVLNLLFFGIGYLYFLGENATNVNPEMNYYKEEYLSRTDYFTDMFLEIQNAEKDQQAELINTHLDEIKNYVGFLVEFRGFLRDNKETPTAKNDKENYNSLVFKVDDSIVSLNKLIVSAEIYNDYDTNKPNEAEPVDSGGQSKLVSYDYSKYINKISLENFEMRKIGSQIAAECESGDKDCIINEMYNYVSGELNYLSDPRTTEYIQSPADTISIGGGDCEDLSILLISLLENLGVSTYIVFTENHAYALACGVDSDNLFNYLMPDYAKKMAGGYDGFGKTEVVGDQIFFVSETEETMDIGKSYYSGWINYSEPENITYVNFEYEISSDKSFDVHFVPSITDYTKFKNGLTYDNYPKCEEKRVYNINGKCENLKSTSGMIIYNNDPYNWQKITIKTKILMAFNKTKYLDLNVISYTINNEKCVVLDPTAGKYGYPGYNAIEGQKIAIDPVTNEKHGLT